MSKYAKEYINKKIENCEKLIEAASSEDQKKVYQEYLDFWRKSDKSKKPRTDPVIKKSEEFLSSMSELKIFKEIETEDADKFELDNAPKQAYYKRNGQWVRTKAFEEYLNKITK